MKLVIEETWRHEVEIDADALINEFRQEADEFFEATARFSDGKAIEEFVTETVHCIGPRDFLEGPWVTKENVPDCRDLDVFFAISK